MITQSLSFPPLPAPSSLPVPSRCSTEPGPPAGRSMGAELFSRCDARLSPMSDARLYHFIALSGVCQRDAVDAARGNVLRQVGLGADADLEEVSDGVHGLDEPSFGRLLCPEECLGVGLWQDAG